MSLPLSLTPPSPRYTHINTSTKRLVFLKSAVKLDELLEDTISLLIGDLDWAILEKVYTVLKRFPDLQKMLEGEYCLTGNLVTPLVTDLWDGLEKKAKLFI